MPTVVDSSIGVSATVGIPLVVSGSDVAIYAFAGDDTAAVQNFDLTWVPDVGDPQALDLLVESTGTGQYLAAYRLLNPAAGTGTLVSSGGSGASLISAAVVSTADIGGTPNGTPVLAELSTGNTATSGAVSSQVGALVLGCMHCNGAVTVEQAAATGSGQTAIEAVDATSNATMVLSTTAGAASVTQSNGTFPGNRRSTYIALSINAPVVGDATINPAQATLTLAGRAATVNTFTSVAIREVFVNEAGSPVANRTGVSLLVWYAGSPAGAPDLSYSALTTDANGTVSWSLAPGGLTFGQTIFYVATDGGASLSNYTCARMVPTYS